MAHLNMEGCLLVTQYSCGKCIAEQLGFQVAAGQRFVVLPRPLVSMAQHRDCLGQQDVRRLELGKGTIGAVIAACMHSSSLSNNMSSCASAGQR